MSGRISVMTKLCRTCQEHRPLSEFHRNKTKSDGRGSNCKTCSEAYKVRYRARPGNKERQAEANSRWRAQNAAHKKDAAQRWYTENRAATIDRSARWAASHPEKAKGSSRQWARRNPEMRAAYQRRRSACKAAAEQDGHTYEDLLASWAERGLDDCVYCGGEFEHVDHAVPLSRGGPHTLDNLVPSCASCNCSKGTMTLDEFTIQQKATAKA